MENNTKEKMIWYEIKKGAIVSLVAILVGVILGISKESLFSLSAMLLVFMFIPVIMDNDVYSLVAKAVISALLILAGSVISVVFGKNDYPLYLYLLLSFIIVSVSFIKYRYKVWKGKY